MLIRLISLALFFAIFLSSNWVSAGQPLPPSAVGSAYDRETGYLLYSEHHFCGEEDMQCTVQYRDNLGVMFAIKHLDYRQGSISPSLVMTDYRRGVEMRVPASEQKDVVVDAGFDNFVRSIWEVLEAGDKAKFPFLVAGFDEPFQMRALRSNASGCTPAELCLNIKLDSWFLGMLVDPIELSYSRAGRRLLRFSGISNIKGVNGESLNVDIHYQYDDELLLVGPAGQQKKTDFKL